MDSEDLTMDGAISMRSEQFTWNSSNTVTVINAKCLLVSENVSIIVQL